MSYVGITGFTKRLQVEELLEEFTQLDFPPGVQLMCGVLASYKSLHGLEMKPEWRFKYPAVERIEDIFVTNNRVLNLLHYNSKEPELALQLERLLELVPSCNGFQLNIAWPPLDQVERFKHRHPEQILVLQLGARALIQVSISPEWWAGFGPLTLRLQPYLASIDYVLLDLSGGVGKELNVELLTRIIAELQHRLGPIKLVVGGGLEASNLDSLLGPLLALDPTLSWDAEGRLFTGEELDLEKCRAYLNASRLTTLRVPRS